MPPVTCQSSRGYFEAMADVFGRLDHDAIDAYVDVIFEAWADERRVFVFGNGGSAYTASHHVTDYVKTASVEGRRRLQAISIGLGFSLQSVETEIAFGAVEGVKREANPFPVKPPLRATTPNRPDELRV